MFAKFKYESSTVIVFVGIRYSMRDLLSDPQTNDTHEIRQMMSALSLASARLSKLRILCSNNLLDGDVCKKYLIFPYFLFFSGFQT